MLNFDPVHGLLPKDALLAASLRSAATAPSASVHTRGARPAAGAGATLEFANNQMIFSEGDEAEHFYKVVSGRVRLCKMRFDGARQIVDLLIPGDIFGLECGKEFTLTGEAIGRTVLERYAAGQIERLSDERLEVRRQLMAMLQSNLSAARNHMMMLGRETARERVAAFLVLLAGRFGITECGVLDLGMGRRDIADYVGLALETVCRELSTLQQEGLIEILDHRRVAIGDVAALQSVSEGQP
jgi:CRP/FNR family nitrogen fixation transcriptional regulator